MDQSGQCAGVDHGPLTRVDCSGMRSGMDCGLDLVLEGTGVDQGLKSTML